MNIGKRAPKRPGLSPVHAVAGDREIGRRLLVLRSQHRRCRPDVCQVRFLLDVLDRAFPDKESP